MRVVNAGDRTACNATAGINATCTGATTCAEDSIKTGIGTRRSQHGATGEEAIAGPCGDSNAEFGCAIRLFIAQCAPQQSLAVGAMDMQASPSAGARSTVRNNPDAMSLRSCILQLYTDFS